MTNDILVIGATSSLGVSICRKLAKDKNNLTLSGRNKDELEKLSNDLSIRFGIDTDIIIVDLAANKISCAPFVTKYFDSVFVLAEQFTYKMNHIGTGLGILLISCSVSLIYELVSEKPVAVKQKICVVAIATIFFFLAISIQQSIALFGGAAIIALFIHLYVTDIENK